MSEHPLTWRLDRGLRVLVALVLALAGRLALPQAARADWAIIGDTVPSGQVIDDDVFARGTNVVMDGTINGDLLAVGSSVEVNGSVTGSLVAIGRTVSINGEVGGSVYVLARTLRLGSTAAVTNNVHFAGLLLDSRPGSQIGRDLVAASVRADIGSEIGRSLSAVILLMTFRGRIGVAPGETLPGDEPETVPSSSGAVDGTLLFVGSSNSRSVGFAAPALVYPLLGQAQDEEEQAQPLTERLPEWLLARLGELVALLLVGGLTLWIRPSLLHQPAERLRRKPLPSAGLGLLALAIAVNAVAIAILLAVLLFVIGIWLGAITLWELAFLFWGIGYPSLILAFALFALTALYGSKVIVADMVGGVILGRLAPQVMDAERRTLPLLLGLVLYVGLRSIPVLGWAIEVVVTTLGLGAIWVAFRHRRRPMPPVVAEADREPDAEDEQD